MQVVLRELREIDGKLFLINADALAFKQRYGLETDRYGRITRMRLPTVSESLIRDVVQQWNKLLARTTPLYERRNKLLPELNELKKQSGVTP
jgi:hypothetical protein